MSNYLENKKCYLSGPIQYASDEFWRGEPLFNLKKRFGIDVFDPFADEKQQWKDEILKAKAGSDTSLLVKIAKSFVRKDLGMVDRSDFLIAYVPTGVQTVGTVHEIINSNNAKKPTLLVTNSNSISDIPLWYFGFIDTKYMFAGWRSLFDYLQAVNDGNHKNDDKWHFVYGIV
jgi:nucleoside 2-deoxyribosyltransferase